MAERRAGVAAAARAGGSGDEAGAKKATTKKATTKKATTKKATTKKATTKKATAKKPTAANKAPAKKGSPRKAATTSLPVRDEEAPWTDAELEAVRGGIATEVERLRREIRASEAQVEELIRNSGDGAGDDQVDSGSKAFEREHEMTIANNAREALAQDEHALERIANGTYGTCESCGNPIGKRRLQAFPRATLCLSCKQLQERR